MSKYDYVYMLYTSWEHLKCSVHHEHELIISNMNLQNLMCIQNMIMYVCYIHHGHNTTKRSEFNFQFNRLVHTVIRCAVVMQFIFSITRIYVWNTVPRLYLKNFQQGYGISTAICKAAIAPLLCSRPSTWLACPQI